MILRKRNERPNNAVKGFNMNERVIDHYNGLNRYPHIDMWYEKYKKVLGYDNIFFTEGVSGAIKNIYEIIRPSKVFHNNDFALYPIFDQIFKGEGDSICFVTHPDTDVERLTHEYKHVVIDDAYQYFCPRSWDDCLKYSNVTIMRSFSKAYGLAGIRLGYVVGELTDTLSYHRAGYEANTLSLEMGYEQLINQDIKDQYVEQCKEGLNFLLSTNKYRHDGFSNCVFHDNEKAFDVLKNKDILVKKCKDSIRITLGPIDIMKKIHNIIEESF